MFEVAELEHRVSKAEFKQRATLLRTRLLEAQNRLKRADFPLIVIISGMDGGGKGEVIRRLNEWLDTRHVRTIALDDPTDEERERPKFWRFWRTLPGRGLTGIYVGSWYSEPLSRRVDDDIDDNGFRAELRDIMQLEKLLADDGALIVKCWLHLQKKQQHKRLKQLSKDPATRWRVTETDWQHLKQYDRFIEVAEQAISETSKSHAPWLIVEGCDSHYSSLTVGQYLVDSIEQHMQRLDAMQHLADQAPPATLHVQQNHILDTLDLKRSIPKARYKADLEKYQGKLNELCRAAHAMQHSSILVFEGWDAAGKGGAIRRLTEVIDPRHYQVIPVAAPSDEERAHHYLWRFWRHIPRAGDITIYDRSWYGRVLVERVEGLASTDEWQRAYSEIVNFEESLLAHDIGILKFWLHIDKDEQMRRFKRREQISYKQFKITEDDYRNREKWDDYQKAVTEMVARTSTRQSPWLLVEANDKYHARLKVIETFCEHLEHIIDQRKK
ncbi:MAG: polyphosphate:AMP phosphotransferase [Methylomonas sp.]|nr:polyphosphate:AMP phosphotransferase [Methylomonas sp.]PPD22668.1 MAG: polyphosphate:AMP phosphotransferase [Methylomonas sp.]PPD27985.1 MAG: polyphosphate:AMP phosphotransferase [Methylomonas sp.]PPD40093.1 MAG: polyphosphate:AMP phosphotransferase [Methylomonas sp.]PPD41603.1 MAG: polyphosphate:AMP phosphotransferase [Methylomonas sp.]